MITKDEKGLALPLVLTLMILFFAILIGFLPVVRNEASFSSYNTKWITARYAAEAAAKYAINRIQSSINSGTVPTTTVTVNGKISTTSPITVTCTYSPDNTTKPTLIQIRATATYGSTTAQANVNYYLGESPVKINGGVVDLISTGTYSHTDYNPNSGVTLENRWRITRGDTDAGIPDCANGTGVSQIMFNNASTTNDIDVTYRAMASRNGASVPGGGYGIYYGMIGNADNFNAYVIQYDPGARNDNSKKYSTSSNYYADKGTLLVKKVIFEPSIYANSSTISSKFKTNTKNSPGYYEKNCWTYDSGGDSNYYALPFQEAKSGEVLRIPLASSDDSAVNGTSLQTLMKNSTGQPFDVDALHKIRIKTEMVNGQQWHYIYCDDNSTPVLKFYDHSGSSTNSGKYKLDGSTGRKFLGTKTGIRIWSDQVTTNFSNEITEDSTELISKAVVWIR